MDDRSMKPLNLSYRSTPASENMPKVDDGNLHIWCPSNFWGDQMFLLTVGKRFANGKDIVIHTDKIACGSGNSWSRMNDNILKFWTRNSIL